MVKRKKKLDWYHDSKKNMQRMVTVLLLVASVGMTSFFMGGGITGNVVLRTAYGKSFFVAFIAMLMAFLVAAYYLIVHD